MTETALTQLARQESGRVLALLARRFGDLDLADEAVQDALVDAARTWPERGVPDNPAAWLHTVARRKALDRLRRAASAQRRLEAGRWAVDDEPSTDRGGAELVVEEGTVEDERLRLLLLCCHPALDPAAQVALTLRLVGGLTTTEIASAFLVPEATLAQRIVRAKRKIRDAGIPLSIPARLDERVDVVLGVLYLIANEGYLSRGGDAGPVRVDLTDEATRLTEVLATLVPEHAEVDGLLALVLFHRARLDSRLDPAGELVLLDDQDRSRWDRATIERANAVLHRALVRMTPGPFQVQALIASHHANARTAADTDWAAIEGLYRQLGAMTASPVVALNHAVAVAMADGPQAGLTALDALEVGHGAAGLGGYHLFHAARGELLLRAGQPVHAGDAFTRARSLTSNPAEQRHLDRRISACDTST